MKEHILIVDDEESIRRALTEVLKHEEYVVSPVESGEEALKFLAGRRVDAVLLDIWMAGMDGLDTLEAILRLDPLATVIMISGHGTIETAVRATKLGAVDFIEKPISLDRLLSVLGQALEAR